jgi:succinate dehydrogenase/fumarate reductase cytochrome b subunit
MASPHYFNDFDWDWLPCVRTYSMVHSVSGVVLFTFPSLKSAKMKVQSISGFAIIDIF